jgi:hypothetical protein
VGCQPIRGNEAHSGSSKQLHDTLKKLLIVEVKHVRVELLAAALEQIEP